MTTMIHKTYPITEKLLTNGLNLSTRLLDLLKKESDSLKKTDSASILIIANKKKEAVSQLETFSKQMGQILATEKLTLTPHGISEYFNKAATHNLDITQSKTLWQQINDISLQCRQLNEKNGACISLLTQHTQRSLQILKGRSQQATTYGRDGTTYSERLSQSIFSV
jgi:flagella synthesis protein FlgN